MLIFVVLHWITYQKQSKEIKRLHLLINLHNQKAEMYLQEALDAKARFDTIQSANKSRKEFLKREIKASITPKNAKEMMITKDDDFFNINFDEFDEDGIK
jgi:hypothetical protein